MKKWHIGRCVSGSFKYNDETNGNNEQRYFLKLKSDPKNCEYVPWQRDEYIGMDNTSPIVVEVSMVPQAKKRFLSLFH